MPEFVQCPECSRKLRVPDDLLGKKVKCPTCGNLFVAEAGGTISAPEEKVAPPRSSRRPPPPPEADEVEDRDEPAEDDEDYDDDDRPRRRSRRRRSRGPRRDATPHRGTLILVLGILSIVLPGFSLILGPIAWVLGSGDLKEIRAGRMDPSGEGQTNGGMICGIVGTCLGVLWLCCCGANFFGAFADIASDF